MVSGRRRAVTGTDEVSSAYWQGPPTLKAHRVYVYIAPVVGKTRRSHQITQTSVVYSIYNAIAKVA